MAQFIIKSYLSYKSPTQGLQIQLCQNKFAITKYILNRAWCLRSMCVDMPLSVNNRGTIICITSHMVQQQLLQRY